MPAQTKKLGALVRRLVHPRHATIGGLSTEVYDADETRTDGKGGTAGRLQR
jgi:hypothetical protein